MKYISNTLVTSIFFYKILIVLLINNIIWRVIYVIKKEFFNSFINNIFDETLSNGIKIHYTVVGSPECYPYRNISIYIDQKNTNPNIAFYRKIKKFCNKVHLKNFILYRKFSDYNGIYNITISIQSYKDENRFIDLVQYIHGKNIVKTLNNNRFKRT